MGRFLKGLNQHKLKKETKMSNNENESGNNLVFLLAGFGLGAIIGAAAGLLFAPKAGEDIREDLTGKFTELKGKTTEWVNEQKARRSAVTANTDEVGA
jgi:gas vesicle protein